MSQRTVAERKLEKAFDLPWWLLLIDGAALILLGLLFFINPTMTSKLLVLFLGIYWFVAGILKIINIFSNKKHLGLKLFAGVLGILAGLLILGNIVLSTVLTAATVVILLGFIGLFFGTAEVIQAIQGGGWGTGILGAVSILIGLLILVNTFVITLALPAILGTLCVIGGIVAIAFAFKWR